jgi:general secretion pathway protein G
MRKGFTLIELLVALAIITILAATLLLYVSNRVEDARISRMEDEIATLRSAVTLLFNDTGNVLNTWQRLVSPGTLINWRGPYIQKAMPAAVTDTWTGASPWKTNYRLYSLSNATTNNFFASTTNLYPFRNAVALEVFQITGQTPAASMLKIDQDLDDGVGNTGFIVAANSNLAAPGPFTTGATIGGLSATYSGATGQSVYILLATF